MKYPDYSRKEPKLRHCKRILTKCDYCDKEFWETQSHHNRKKRHFCCTPCYANYRHDFLPKEEQHAYKNGGLPIEEKQKRLKARSDLNHAIQQGKINRLPCRLCGKKQSQAHHPDYNKPLDVEWLCLDCHWQIHKTIYENPELLERK